MGSMHNNFESVEVYENNVDVTAIIAEKIKQYGLSDPFYICDLREVVKKISLWRSSLPQVRPFYAVKANSSPVILKVLADFGVNFDCASKNEIAQILSLGVHPDRIIYAHTIKVPETIKYANKVGVKLMTFDNSEELYKMKRHCPDVRAVLRIKSDAKEALVKFGSKFGCDVEKEANRLIRVAHSLSVDLVGVSFHVGVGCKDLNAYYNAIKSAGAVFRMARVHGYNLSILDIGGGFPGADDKYFKHLAVTINQAIEDHFYDEPIEVIAEPGTFLVNSSHTLACNVISKKTNLNSKRVYYINDGIYGSFSRDHQFGIPITMYPLKHYSDGKLHPSVLFGVTCATPDRLSNDLLLPAMDIGDWLIFKNMGAYSLSLCTCFNGFSYPEIYYVFDENELSYKDVPISFNFKHSSITTDNLLSGVLNIKQQFTTTFCIDKD